MDLLLGLDQAGLGPRRPLGSPAFPPRRLPAGPRGVLRSPEQAHDPVLSIARWHRLPAASTLLPAERISMSAGAEGGQAPDRVDRKKENLFTAEAGGSV